MTDNFAEVRRLLHADDTDAAFSLLKTLKQTAPPHDMWQVHELYGEAFFCKGDAEGAAAAYLNAAKADRFLTAQMQHFSNYLFALQYLPNIDAAQMFGEHLFYDKLAEQLPKLPPKKTRRSANGKIRVGYFAPSFASSAAAYFFAPLLTEFDPEQFSVFAYSFADMPPKNAAVTFRLLPPDYAQAAQIIQNDDLDIFTDLGGHSTGGRGLIVAAHRVAPVQIAAVGYLNTTGLAAMNFIFADNIMWHASDEDFFTEKPLMLPQAFCFTPDETMKKMRPNGAPANQTEANRNDGKTFTFGILNNFMKITDSILFTVKKILDAVPTAKLVLQDTTNIKERLRQMRRRTDAAGRSARDDFLATSYDGIDLILDTAPYPGGAMTATALFMGVPVLALKGVRYGGRFADELLTAANCREFLANNAYDYAAKAVKFARGELPLPRDISFAASSAKYMQNTEKAYKACLAKRLTDNGANFHV